jgi:YhcH/YjgK/YiaL family protein
MGYNRCLKKEGETMLINGTLAQKEPYPLERLDKALGFLAKTDFLSLSPGSVIPIDGDNIFMQVQEYSTQDPAGFRFETHDNYYDIQYVVKGMEYIEYLPRNLLSVPEAYDPVNDITFYNDMVSLSGRILLRAGDFTVISPFMGHKPRCRAGDESETVRKIVIKVRS